MAILSYMIFTWHATINFVCLNKSRETLLNRHCAFFYYSGFDTSIIQPVGFFFWFWILFLVRRLNFTNPNIINKKKNFNGKRKSVCGQSKRLKAATFSLKIILKSCEKETLTHFCHISWSHYAWKVSAREGLVNKLCRRLFN